MSFFEELKRNASDVADKAIKKTNELSNLAKYNVNIKTAEAKLAGIYEEIGRLFYTSERAGLDHTAEIADAIMKADAYNSEIASLKRELEKFRKVKTCTGCGSEIGMDSVYCSLCGTKQPEPAIEEIVEEVKETAQDVAEDVADSIEEAVDDIKETVEDITEQNDGGEE